MRDTACTQLWWPEQDGLALLMLMHRHHGPPPASKDQNAYTLEMHPQSTCSDKRRLDTHTHKHTNTTHHEHPRTRTRTRTHTRTRARAHAHARTRTPARARAHAHTHALEGWSMITCHCATVSRHASTAAPYSSIQQLRNQATRGWASLLG